MSQAQQLVFVAVGAHRIVESSPTMTRDQWLPLGLPERSMSERYRLELRLFWSRPADPASRAKSRAFGRRPPGSDVVADVVRRSLPTIKICQRAAIATIIRANEFCVRHCDSLIADPLGKGLYTVPASPLGDPHRVESFRGSGRRSLEVPAFLGERQRPTGMTAPGERGTNARARR